MNKQNEALSIGFVIKMSEIRILPSIAEHAECDARLGRGEWKPRSSEARKIFSTHSLSAGKFHGAALSTNDYNSGLCYRVEPSERS